MRIHSHVLGLWTTCARWNRSNEEGEGCLTDADCATAPCTGVGVDDDVICPTPDADLISCPVN